MLISINKYVEYVLFTHKRESVSENNERLTKNEFKEKLDTYFKAHEHEQEFDDEIKSYPKVLSKLLYDRHEQRWKTKAKRVELVNILKNIDEESILYTMDIENPSTKPKEPEERINLLDKKWRISLYQAIPELFSFFEWLESPEFRELSMQINDTKQSIIEIFFDTQDPEEKTQGTKTVHSQGSPENAIQEKEQTHINETTKREYLSKTTQKIRRHLNEKVKEFISPAEYIYFFKYTRIQVRMLNNDEEKELIGTRRKKNMSEEKIRRDILLMNVIELQVPLAINECSLEKTPYIMKKFDTQFLPRFETILSQEMKANKRNRIYRYNIKNNQELYEARKKEIWSQNYQKFAQCEIRGTESNKGSQSFLFKTELCIHNGNEEANRLLQQQLDNRQDIYKESNQWIVIQSSGKIDKKVLIENFLERAKETLPCIKIQNIDAKKFSEEFIAIRNPRDQQENYDNKKIRIRDWIDHNVKRDNPNLFVIHDIHELENRISSQKTLVEEILSSKNCKFLITSNKDISSFPEATLKKWADNKPDKREKWFIPELLSHIERSTRTSVCNPDRESCWKILWTMIENRYPNNKFSKNIIQWIGRNLPDPAIYNAVIDEIMLKCNKWDQNFTIDMALEIIQNRRGKCKPELEDVHKIVEKYINEEEENAIHRTTTEKAKTIKRYTIYLIKELAHNKYTNESIANYLKISIPMVNKYYADAVPYRGPIMPIKEKVEKNLMSKEGMLLLFN